jgi:hypothetical protein
MANIHISDITTTELQELDLLTNFENDLKDLSNVEQDNVQGGYWLVALASVAAFAYIVFA